MSLKCKSRIKNAYAVRKTEFRLGCRFLLLKNRQLLLSDFSFYRIERDEQTPVEKPSFEWYECVFHSRGSKMLYELCLFHYICLMRTCPSFEIL